MDHVVRSAVISVIMDARRNLGDFMLAILLVCSLVAGFQGVAGTSRWCSDLLQFRIACNALTFCGLLTTSFCGVARS